MRGVEVTGRWPHAPGYHRYSMKRTARKAGGAGAAPARIVENHHRVALSYYSPMYRSVCAAVIENIHSGEAIRRRVPVCENR